jgi:polysaccharide pyruvyl transferase WcaK-like protein
VGHTRSAEAEAEMDLQTLLPVLWRCLLHHLYPSDDFGMASSLNKDNNGGNQVEDRCYEGPEEVL